MDVKHIIDKLYYENNATKEELIYLLDKIKEDEKDYLLEKSDKIRKKYYDNKDIREMLKVNDKLIRKYRELGMLGYSQYGGKYWYSSEDIKCFLEKCRCRS